MSVAVIAPLGTSRTPVDVPASNLSQWRSCKDSRLCGAVKLMEEEAATRKFEKGAGKGVLSPRRHCEVRKFYPLHFLVTFSALGYSGCTPWKFPL
jgi:hypothetical protein